MVVQHNMQAVNANRQFSLTTAAQQKSTEKLSSGYRINRAGDDAAGLAISEKMRKQIKGLDRASTNAQDGISAVQTAEGALGEVQSMLQRMNELAVQSANGTNSISDRTAIQNEIDQLTTEIDRVSQTTKFNETYLLKGDAAVTKDVRYQYLANNAGTNNAAVYFGNNQTRGTDATTGLTVQVGFTPTSGNAAHQDYQNAIARSIRDSGLSVSLTHTWDATTNSSIAEYNLELTGDAAQQYQIVATTLMNTNGEGVFEIQTRGGEFIAKVTVSGGGSNLPAATPTDQVHTSSAVISATSATAARTSGHGESAEYFDRDGNRISNNALNRYVQLASGSITNATGSGVVSNTGGSSGTSAIPTGSGTDITPTEHNYRAPLLDAVNAMGGTTTFICDRFEVRNGAPESRFTATTNSSLTLQTSFGVLSQNANMNGTQIADLPAYIYNNIHVGDSITVTKAEYSVGTLPNGVSISSGTTTNNGFYAEAGHYILANGGNSGDTATFTYTSRSNERSGQGAVGNKWDITYNGTTSEIGDNLDLGLDITDLSALTSGTSFTVTLTNAPTLTYRSASASTNTSGGGATSTPSTPSTPSSTPASSSYSGGTGGVQVRGNAPLVYDAVGNLTNISTANIGAVRDITGALRLDLHVGADATKENKIQVNIKTMSSKALGVNGLRVDGSDSTNADYAIETIKEALQRVSDQRAELGAVQNRLEHTINNLDNVVENTEAAESRIRDTDMADEMVTYSKNSICCSQSFL